MSTPSGNLSTWLVIVGVFAAGALGGAAARSLVWVGSGGPRLSLEEDRQPRTESRDRNRDEARRASFGGSSRFVKHLQKSLDLTAEQATRIGEILDERERETNALFETIEPQMREALERTEAEIRDVLEEDQQERFDEVVKEGRRRYGNGTFRRRGPSRPRGDRPQ